METVTGDRCATSKWAEFAEEDALGYIMTDLAGADPQLFWESGRKTVNEELLPVIREFGVTPTVGLEIGCGVGRLVLPNCAVFDEMVGVDISEGMTRRARAFADERGVSNARFVTVGEPADLVNVLADVTGRVSFIYSLLVFQHIPDFETIDSYLAAVSRLLSRDGIAYLQFDSRRQTLPYRIKTALPDWALPRYWRRGVRRIRLSATEIERSLAEKALTVVGERSPQSAYHRYVLRLA
jgi:cyclopropane fatty-acyl-phospholipid synthase-like methyltransferase